MSGSRMNLHGVLRNALGRPTGVHLRHPIDPGKHAWRFHEIATINHPESVTP